MYINRVAECAEKKQASNSGSKGNDLPSEWSIHQNYP